MCYLINGDYQEFAVPEAFAMPQVAELSSEAGSEVKGFVSLFDSTDSAPRVRKEFPETWIWTNVTSG